MTDPFVDPASSTGIKWEDLNGRLLAIKPHEVVENMQTAFGTANAVRADVFVLDGPGAPEEYLDTLIFPKVLAGQVRSNAGTGQLNLGRLGKGNAKPGQSAPWMLAAATDEDRKVASAWYAGTAKPPF